jgi:hypothetical protein
MNAVRKNININSENDTRVQKNRSLFLGLNKPVDIDYSTMVNLLIELGDALIKFKHNPELSESEQDAQTKSLTEIDIEKIIEKYLN